MFKKDAYYQQSAEIWTPNSWSEMGANYFHIHILDHLTCFTRCCLGKLQKKSENKNYGNVENILLKVCKTINSACQWK